MNFPTLTELRENYRNLKFYSDEMWVVDASGCTFYDAEERLRSGRWTTDQFEGFALVWAQNKIGSDAANYRNAGAFNAYVQYLADFLASVMNIHIVKYPVTIA